MPQSPTKRKPEDQNDDERMQDPLVGESASSSSMMSPSTLPMPPTPVVVSPDQANGPGEVHLSNIVATLYVNAQERKTFRCQYWI